MFMVPRHQMGLLTQPTVEGVRLKPSSSRSPTFGRVGMSPGPSVLAKTSFDDSSLNTTRSRHLRSKNLKKAQVTLGDGRIVELSSDEEIDPVTNKPVHVPTSLMAPYMAPGSLQPVTLKESRAVKKQCRTDLDGGRHGLL